MPRKSYRQYCGVARALDVVGERWFLLIARNLLLGPRRYSDLLAELPGITTNLLAKRLRELEALELVERQPLPPPLSAAPPPLWLASAPPLFSPPFATPPLLELPPLVCLPQPVSRLTAATPNTPRLSRRVC